MNSAYGWGSLANNTSGRENSGLGVSTLSSNTVGSYNTATGSMVLSLNTSGSNNTASGWSALQFNTTASDNTAMGYKALYTNTTGTQNVAVGSTALSGNTTGNGNTATGYQTLLVSTTGAFNTATGNQALMANTTGMENTGTGWMSLKSNTIGSQNAAIGPESLMSNTTGNMNAAVGDASLMGNSTGSNNAAIGFMAGATNATGNSNTFVGAGANAATNALSNVTAIGAGAIVAQSDSLVLGRLAGTDYSSGAGLPVPATKVGIGTTTPGATLDLFGTLRISNSATHYVGFVADPTTTGATYLLPTTSGTAGQFLQTNGTAINGTVALSWATPAGGSGAGTGITSLNNLTGVNQTLGTPVTSGSVLGWTSSGLDHVLNIPMASTTGVAAGLISKTDYDGFSSKAALTGIAQTITALSVTGLQAPVVGSDAVNKAYVDSLVSYGGNNSITNGAFGYRALINNTTGTDNFALGNNALQANTIGYFNIGIGSLALGINTTGAENNAMGVNALGSNTTGSDNVAIGTNSLRANSVLSESTAIGAYSMQYSITANNTAVGAHSLEGSATPANNTGLSNTAIGHSALKNNTSGSFNVATGLNALTANTTGSRNVANGLHALYANTTGSDNVANGSVALLSNTTGTDNTAIGSASLQSTIGGSANTALGKGALAFNLTGSGNVGIGSNTGGYMSYYTHANYAGNNNTYIGTSSGPGADFQVTTINNSTAIGYNSTVSQSDSLILGTINGVHGSTATTQVGIGTDRPMGAFQVMGSNTTQTGTITTAGTTTVTGSGTSFTTQFSAGDKIVIASIPYTIASIASNTSLTTYDAVPAASAVAFAKTSNSLIVSSTNGYVGIGLTAPTYQLQLSTDSAAKPGTSTWTIASDARLKNIRAPFTRGLASMEGIHPIYFKYKEGNELGLPTDKEYVGIIAQDAKKAVPESVQVDDKGYFHVTNDSIIWTMFNGIKELFSKFKELVARVITIEDTQTIQSRAIASVKAESAAKDKKIHDLEMRLERLEKAMKK
jgi:hypothetical protein